MLEIKRIAPDLALKCLRLVLRPVAKYCLRHALKLSDMVEVCKEVLLEAAKGEMLAKDIKVTASKLSIMTGVHRRDVQRMEHQTDQINSNSDDLSTRLVGQWQSDLAFCSDRGKPRTLTYGFESSEFNQLVKRVNKELNPATILFELERIGVVERQGDKLKLIELVFAPKGDMEFGYKIVSADVEDLLAAVEENILENNEVPNLHTRTEYDNIRPSALPEIKKWALIEGRQLHARARQFISQFDQDLNPTGELPEPGTKVVLSSFSKTFEKKVEK